MREIIKLLNLSKNKILYQINLIINEGECISIMGNSGVGKSTLLNIMSGIEKPSDGKVFILGIILNNIKEPKLTKFRTNNISYVYQDYKLIEYLSVEENIKFIERSNYNKIDNNKYDNLINNLGLIDIVKKKVELLSGGQKQRVAIARALLSDSKIVFADEPTGALDLVNTKKVLEQLITNSKLLRKTLIIVTHSPEVAMQTERILIMKKGRIVEDLNSLKINKNLLEEKILNEY